VTDADPVGHGGRRRAADELTGIVIAIFGPTASGKSAVAEALTTQIPAEIVCADAMQAYRGLPILTNQPEQPTRLVGIWPLDHEGSVGEYQRLAHAAVDDVLAAGRTPVVAGGTGLYLRAALAELDLPSVPPPGARVRWERLYDESGADAAHAALAERDPAAAAAVHRNDRRRVVRALELADAGATLAPETSRLWTEDTRRATVIFGLEVPAETLNRRIEERTRKMVERGVEDEVTRALAQPLSTTARKVIGLEDFASLPEREAITAVALKTRRYAAYQRKWLRRLPGVVSVRADRPPDAVADEILEVARARERLPARRAG
jgi:tRNA dimethylallyltransferase